MEFNDNGFLTNIGKNNEKKIIALFDLDGTLTYPRQLMPENVSMSLRQLRQKVNIGLVSGSDLSKINEQCGSNATELFDFVFAENGTVAFHGNNTISFNNIANYIGEEKLKEIINFVLNYLSTVDIPIKRGTFIEYRASMLNVSPIGRNCTLSERLDFEEYDKKHGVREKLIKALRNKFPNYDLQFTTGGQISIDIFPSLWNKSYCLKFLEEFDEVHFFGDKTHYGGNDYEIYEDKRTIGHTVFGPESVINEINKVFLNN